MPRPPEHTLWCKTEGDHDLMDCRVACPMCEPIPVKDCRECNGTRLVSPEDRAFIMKALRQP